MKGYHRCCFIALNKKDSLNGLKQCFFCQMISGTRLVAQIGEDGQCRLCLRMEKFQKSTLHLAAADEAGNESLKIKIYTLDKKAQQMLIWSNICALLDRRIDHMTYMEKVQQN